MGIAAPWTAANRSASLPDQEGDRQERPECQPTSAQTLEGALACLIEDYRLSGIRAEPDHPSLFNGHQS